MAKIKFSFYTQFVGLILFILNLVLLILNYDNFPDRVACRFGFQGEPVGWMLKKDFFVLHLGIFLFMNLIFFCLSSSLVRKLPFAMLNMPWKKHWSQNPERIEQGYALLRNSMAFTLLYINIVDVFVTNTIFQINGLKPIVPISPVHLLYGIFILTGFFILRLILMFRPPSQ